MNFENRNLLKIKIERLNAKGTKKKIFLILYIAMIFSANKSISITENTYRFSRLQSRMLEPRKTLCLRVIRRTNLCFVCIFHVWEKNAELYYLIVKSFQFNFRILYDIFFSFCRISSNNGSRVYVWSKTVRFYLSTCIFIVIWYCLFLYSCVTYCIID